ncbi:hypothetical protein [Lentzea sp. CA-135723]|uniref:hypothetical protein n=1 Tax=Lentzea sp. CA-135723 TaxID=3239950 RepID=UPI003D912B7E
MTEHVPTVCVSNAIDTYRAFLAPADDVEEHLAGCFAQQDQALYWAPTAKLLVTYEPVRDLEWQAGFLGLGEVVNISPAKTAGSLFADVLADPSAVEAIVRYAGPGRRVRLIPHTTTAELWQFADVLAREHGIRVDLPESTPDQALRDLLDTKTGLRDLAAGLGMATGPFRLPDGVHCTSTEDVVAAVGRFLDSGTPCIVKADRGEASTGLLVFKPGHDRAAISGEVLASPFYGTGPVVVEEFISGAVEFPSIEFVVPANGEPFVFSVTEMLFEGETHVRGDVTARELEQRWWCAPFAEGGLRLASAMRDRGYRGHFGIDAIARDGEVFMHDLNARRTGSTHLHEFGVEVLGPNYLDTHVVGHFVCHGLPTDMPLDQLLGALGDLVRSPKNADTGIVPAELCGLSTGRVSLVAFCRNLAEFHDMITTARAALRDFTGEHK